MSRKLRSVVMRSSSVVAVVFILLSLALSGSINPLISFGVLVGSTMFGVIFGIAVFTKLYRMRERDSTKATLPDDILFVMFLYAPVVGSFWLWMGDSFRNDGPAQVLGFIGFLLTLVLPALATEILTMEMDKWRKPD